MLNKQKIREEFYQDVARYVYDYLYDSDLEGIVIKLDSKQEKRLMKTLMEKCFYASNDTETDYVRLEMFDLGVRGRYVIKGTTLNMDNFMSICYKYALNEDSRLPVPAQRGLFKEILDIGFETIINQPKM